MPDPGNEMAGERTGRYAPGDMVAAVDLGSNSFHLVVARRTSGTLVVVDRLKDMVRLAGGLGADGSLERAARRHALESLRRLGQRLRELPRGSVRAVGTNTLRQMRDDSFLVEAEQALGHPVEIVSGVEEARLIYLGVAASLADNGASRLVVDIGGGSTELIVGADGRPLRLESLDMGCVTLARQFFADGRYSETAWGEATRAAAMELEPVATLFHHRHWTEAIGASGTIRAIQAVAQAQGWCSDGVLDANGVRRVCQAVLRAGTESRLRLAGLARERRPVFAAGVAVLAAVFESLQVERMLISDGALREGLLRDLLGRMQDEDSRDASVRGLAGRYHVDAAQAGRVSASALALFAQVMAPWGLTAEDRRLLRWGAELHEVGLDIAHERYHRHGEYVARHADMAGFSRQDQAALSVLIRGHRRKLQQDMFASAPPRESRRMLRLTVLLRLAVVLNRGRHPDPPLDLRLEPGRGDRLCLVLPGAWLEAHPLTLADLEQEAGYLSAVGLTLDVRQQAADP